MALKAIGGHLRLMRKSEGISLRAAARRAECSSGWLSQLETGHVSIKSTSLGAVPFILKAYKLDRVAFLDLVGIQ